MPKIAEFDYLPMTSNQGYADDDSTDDERKLANVESKPTGPNSENADDEFTTYFSAARIQIPDNNTVIDA